MCDRRINRLPARGALALIIKKIGKSALDADSPYSVPDLLLLTLQ